MGRRVLKAFGVTPARYEMLSAIGEGATQKELWQATGLARATVCEMLCVLEQLEWVMTWRHGRTKFVSLTSRGEKILDAAYGECVGNGRVTMAIDAALGNIELDSEQTLEARLASDQRLRWFFRDGAQSELHRFDWYENLGHFAWLEDRHWPEDRPPFVDEVMLPS